ncbi:hypothetical protein JX265_001659 [Neoarthrinium moseri]|uniref:lytic cellulose monooxygenase (C4-dehydrogenating) n=1 Tax=Neoarthrinium moseri TaxID=1658444 RepID=A0A9Q0AUT8_9PEZI|nr:hypothetical protein JX266_010799 [Neoarthrinium moseri]KAI1880038.1 hypothetical protein JX265_001659 [Neoarthrinium moseri]
MKSAFYAAILAYIAQHAAAHATFQQLWVAGVDQGTTCARVPSSNSPVTDVTSADMACNAGTSAVSSNCAVTAGSTVTIEMHQQPNDRSCSNEAIGGAHYGPVLAYLSSVSDAKTATGTDGGWFKIFEDTWSSAGASGSDDNWGTKDLNKCCGKMDVLIPADIAPGDYLLRAEAIALHSAGSAGGAQMYMTCYQITVTGSGNATPETVSFPGAYAASDPGLLINIYQSMSAYEAPGPAVYSGGSTKVAGGDTCPATGAAAATLVPTTSSSAATTSVIVSSKAASTSQVATTQVQPVITSTAAATSSATATSVASSAKPSSTGGSTCERRRRLRRRS